MLSSIGDYLVRKYQDVPSDTAVDAFLHLMVRVVQHQSLMVSIPAVVTWGKLLNKTERQHSDRFSPMIGPLLETAISRLVRYEYLSEDSNDPSLLFLMEDTDTMPERHAFLGNYRRYSCQVIEAIVQLKLFDAVSHILNTTDHVLQNLYSGEQAFDSEFIWFSTFISWSNQGVEAQYAKHNKPSLKVDCYFTVIEAMLRGYLKWKQQHPDDRVSVTTPLLIS